MGFSKSDDEEDYMSFAVGKYEDKQVDCQGYEHI